MNLASAAEYFKTGKASKLFQLLVDSVKTIFTFAQERANRPIRYLRVMRAYKQGVPVNDIVATYGCSRSTIQRYRTLAGEPPRPRSDDPERRAKIIALQGSLSQAETARRHGCSVSLVSLIEHEAGIARYGKRPRKTVGKKGQHTGETHA